MLNCVSQFSSATVSASFGVQFSCERVSLLESIGILILLANELATVIIMHQTTPLKRGGVVNDNTAILRTRKVEEKGRIRVFKLFAY